MIAYAISALGFALVGLLIWWLTSSSKTAAVQEHKAEEAIANADATTRAATELARHVDRADTVRDLRGGVF